RDAQLELLGRAFHGRRREHAAAPRGTVGLRQHERNLDARAAERTQARQCEVGGPGEDYAGRHAQRCTGNATVKSRARISCCAPRWNRLRLVWLSWTLFS